MSGANDKQGCPVVQLTQDAFSSSHRQTMAGTAPSPPACQRKTSLTLQAVTVGFFDKRYKRRTAFLHCLCTDTGLIS